MNTKLSETIGNLKKEKCISSQESNIEQKCEERFKIFEDKSIKLLKESNQYFTID